MADSKKYNGSTWQHSLRKLTTATADIEPTIYTDGTPITSYTIKGNTVQDGTPTPSNPVEVNGVGERTENLFDYNVMWWRNNVNDSTNHTDTSTTRIKSDIQDISDSNSYISLKIFAPITNMRIIGIGFFGDDVTTKLPDSTTITITNTTIIQQIPTGAKHYFILLGNDNGSITSDTKTALASAQICAIYGDVLPNTFIPYGYKIPISTGGVTTNIYTTEPLMKIGEYADIINSDGTVTRNIGCIDLSEYNFTYIPQFQIWESTTIPNIKYVSSSTELGNALAENYINHTASGLYAAVNNFAISTSSVSVNTGSGSISPSGKLYYALSSSTTETITAQSIPTTEGANSITVDTTVQPSEFTATWTGWHNASVKEWDGSDWQ